MGKDEPAHSRQCGDCEHGDPEAEHGCRLKEAPVVCFGFCWHFGPKALADSLSETEECLN